MGLRLFQKFSMVWEQFEQQIKTEFLKRFQADEIYQPETHPRALSALYDTVGWRYWKYSAAGAPWFQQFEELFFDSQYYKFREKFYRYCGLDAMAAERLPQLPDKTATQVYTQILKPCLDARKQEIQKDFQYLELQLHHPVSYTLTLQEGKKQQEFPLTFQSAYRKNSKSVNLERYLFSFHMRVYPNVNALWKKDIEALSENVFLGQDIYGKQVLKFYTSIPTFDSADREWDGKVLKFLLFDGRAINMVVLRGGYRIAHLTFYKTLLSADCRLKAYFDKLDWSTRRIDWKQKQ